MRPWMIYGANGFTGELIAREAVRRGLRPILGGRSATVTELARELGLEAVVISLDDREALEEALSDLELVLHCAGPFGYTSEPMVRACIATGCDYLDITGEIGVFESIFALDAEARSHGVTLLPGVGFDVVPSDCLAATLAERMPDATSLLLAFFTQGGSVSRGTMKTMIEGLGEGGAIRRGGKIVRVPTLFDVREIDFASGRRTAMAIPWGDVSTAFHTTRIPDIRVLFATPPRTIRMLRRAGWLLPLFRIRLLKRLLAKRADRQQGPDETMRKTARVQLYGEVTNARGERLRATMSTPDGYAFTVESALAAVERFMSEEQPSGAYTPARLFGAEFAEELPGVESPRFV